MSGVFLLDKRLAKTAVDKRLGDRHKDCQHGNQAKLLRQKQSGQDNHDDKLDPLLTKPLEKTPEKPMKSL